VEKILQEVESLKRVGKDYAAQDQGNLVIAATHTQARYSLPTAIAEFKKRFPKVHLSILQGSPTQVAEMVIHDQADIAIATEAIANYKELVSLPCFQWHHVAVVQPDHPLLERKLLTLDDLAQYPIITYDNAFAGRSKINQAFALRHLTPDIVLEAIDADVIKTYVELGLGVGILADIAFNPERDKHLRAMPVGHLFGTNVTRLALKQGAYLRSYVYTLVELLSPSMNRKLIEQALSGEHESYEL
jgi:LysR family cys regulon transcriptional activator